MIFIDSKKELRVKLSGDPLDLIAELSTVITALYDTAPDDDCKELLNRLLHHAVDLAMLDDDAIAKKAEKINSEKKLILEMGYTEED